MPDTTTYPDTFINPGPGIELTRITSEEIQKYGVAAQHEKERQGFRTVVQRLYPKEAAIVRVEPAQKYNDENDLEAMNHIEVTNAADDELEPDFTLPFWFPHLHNIQEIKKEGISYYVREYIRRVIETELMRYIPDWTNLLATYDIREETEVVCPVLYIAKPLSE